jgi:predicted glycosyltransferase
MPDTFNILMYSHDTYGLGHIRRTMAIATHLIAKNVNILILTGSPIVGRFSFPEGIDFVRVPGMIKRSNTIYVPHTINIDAHHALHIRQSIIEATAKAFDPKLFIVDKVPLGLKGELKPTLEWFRNNRPKTKIVLGLRDVLDDAESTRREWEQKKFEEVLDELYSEIWIYGNKDLYDPVVEYAMPERISRKVVYTGYIPRPRPPRKYFDKGKGRKKLVVVTTGGGGDGYPVLDNYLGMLEQNGSSPFRSLVITGPFIPRDQLDELVERARARNVPLVSFMKKIERKLAEADLIISMGGYNTICEVLSLQKNSLIIPREDPRMEQRIRAEMMKARGLVDFIPWGELSPARLHEKISQLLEHPEEQQRKVRSFTMTGLDVMRSRLEAFRKEAQ